MALTRCRDSGYRDGYFPTNRVYAARRTWAEYICIPYYDNTGIIYA